MCKNISCPSCSTTLASVKDNKLVISYVKAISSVEIDFNRLTSDVKCHTCHNWSSIDKENNIVINYKRKGQDVMFNQNRK